MFAIPGVTVTQCLQMSMETCKLLFAQLLGTARILPPACQVRKAVPRAHGEANCLFLKSQPSTPSSLSSKCRKEQEPTHLCASCSQTHAALSTGFTMGSPASPSAPAPAPTPALSAPPPYIAFTFGSFFFFFLIRYFFFSFGILLDLQKSCNDSSAFLCVHLPGHGKSVKMEKPTRERD